MRGFVGGEWASFFYSLKIDISHIFQLIDLAVRYEEAGCMLSWSYPKEGAELGTMLHSLADVKVTKHPNMISISLRIELA